MNRALACDFCGESPVIARGMCNAHYRRFRRHGNALLGAPRRSALSAGSLAYLIENSEERPGPLDTPCRIWLRAIDAAGYGRTSLEGTRDIEYAHRRMYELVVGPIPEGLYVCHRCDVRACCASGHLFAGTAFENNHDAIAKGRMWHPTKANPIRSVA